MTYKLEIYSALCATSLFEINGIPADPDDFGYGYDADPDNAEDYGCGNRVFESYDEPKKEVLEKYHLTKSEYAEICSDLVSGLSFGCCGLCI